TQEEFQKIRIHPQVGAEIIAAVPFPYPVAPLIMSHHERWDGKGYPQGLSAENIPVGARILTIVDYYDAVTTERPYHKALSHESAHLVEAREDRPLVGLRALPPSGGFRHAEMPLRRRCRRAATAQRLGEDGRRPLGLGGAQPPHAGERASARRVRGGRRRRAD